MQNLIKDGIAVERDDWQIYEAGDAQGIPGTALLPVSFWADHGNELEGSSMSFGAIIKAGEDIDALLPFLSQLQIIAIEFSKFADGRGFSQARQLRSLHNFHGEIRAMGDVMPDQVAFLIRSGFNAIVCRNTAERDTALAIKDLVDEQYQSDAVIDTPLFRRR